MDNFIYKDTKNSLNEIDEKKLNKSKKIGFINIFLIAAIFVGLFLYMFFVDGLDNITLVLSKVNYKFVIIGLVFLFMQLLCNAICLHLPLKKLYPNQKFSNSVKVSMLGQLFNNITPFSSGGQPMQAYELSKTGKKVSDSLTALAMQFIVTQTALICFTVLSIIFEFDFCKNLFQNNFWFAILGIGANVILILVIILAGLNKKFIAWITTPSIKLLGKIKIIKKPEETIEKFDLSLQNFNNQFKWMLSQKKTLLKVFFVAFAQSFFYYGITYMVYRAFGNNELGFLQIVPAQALLLLIMTITPTPGAGIGAEGGFLLLFNSIFKQGTINMSILFWRIYTFYLPIILGAFFLLGKKEKQPVFGDGGKKQL